MPSIAPFSYTSPTPVGYQCMTCHARGVRLYHHFRRLSAHDAELHCDTCLGAMGASALSSWRPAIPTETGERFWKYEEAPNISHRWWCALPVKGESVVPTGPLLALELVERYSRTDGTHHKAWVFDQVVRALTGCPFARGESGAPVCQGESAAYSAWVARVKTGEDGPESFRWDTGIAP